MTQPRTWWQLRAQSDATDLLIYEDIGESWWSEGLSAKDLVTALAGIL